MDWNRYLHFRQIEMSQTSTKQELTSTRQPSPWPQHRCIWKNFSLRLDTWLTRGRASRNYFGCRWGTWVAEAQATWPLHPSLLSLAIAIVSCFLSRGFYCFYQKKFGKDDGQHFSMCQLWLFAVCVSSKSWKNIFCKAIVMRAYQELDVFTQPQGLILWVYCWERC